MDWRGLVRQVAPAIGTALGGPVGGAAAAVISRTLLGKDSANDDELAAAVAGATPEQLAALRKADQEFAAKMKELDIDVFRLEVADRQSARQMFSVNIWPQTIAGAMFVGGYFATLGLVLTGSVKTPPEWQPVLMTLLGMLGAGVTQVLAWLYGSTLGSREKTAALAASMPGRESK